MEAGTTVQITMPQMGDSVTEGTVLEWHKQVGDQVEANETLLEVSTDKVDAEVPAPVGGTLVRILVEADETVPVGTILGEIDTTNGAAAAPDESRGDESGADMSDPGATEMSHVAAKNQAEQAAPPGELVDVVLPQMGESVQEGTVLEWHKQVGDEVAEGETLVEISTDKVDAEIPSPVAGVVAEILAEPDETVQSGTIVARIQPGAAARGGAQACTDRRAGSPAGSERERRRERDARSRFESRMRMASIWLASRAPAAAARSRRTTSSRSSTATAARRRLPRRQPRHRRRLRLHPPARSRSAARAQRSPGS